MSFVSFITPSYGNDEGQVRRTIASVRQQTDEDWELIFVASGYTFDMNYFQGDNRCWVCNLDEYADKGTARNIALQAVESQWAAFVDEGDIVTPNYTKFLKDHASAAPDADVIVFRMNHPSRGPLPPGNATELRDGEYGISFAVRSHWLKTTEFPEGDVHGQGLIDALIRKGARVFVSPFQAYVVRPDIPRAAS